jgi:hypothetical protein
LRILDLLLTEGLLFFEINPWTTTTLIQMIAYETIREIDNNGFMPGFTSLWMRIHYRKGFHRESPAHERGIHLIGW